MTNPRPLWLAHRGDWRDATENSLAAFRAGLELSVCDGLEFDVRAAADGVPVVIHDASLARVQGLARPVASTPVAELADLGVPTLGEVLALADASAFLDIELKEDIGVAVVPLVVAARGDPPSGAVISSFQPAVIASIRRLRPAWPCWLNTTGAGPGTIDLAVTLGCTGLAVRWHGLDRRAVARCRAAGLVVAAWTVRRPATVRRLTGLGVDVLIVEGQALEA